MEFSDILAIFDINQFLKVDNYILGQNGYIFSLERGVAYLYEETKGRYFAEIYVNGERRELAKNELDKLHSLIRLQRRKPRKVQAKDLWIYSRHIERTMRQLLEYRPDLEKGSTHLAFAPKNYTRFSENLLFDFNYFYNDQDIIGILSNYDEIHSKNVKKLIQKDRRTIKQVFGDDPDQILQQPKWDDGNLYRYLLDYIRKHRISINGKITSPQFLRTIYQKSLEIDASNVFFHLGPYLLCLKANHRIDEVMPRKQNINLEQLKQSYEIIEPDAEMISRMFNIEF